MTTSESEGRFFTNRIDLSRELECSSADYKSPDSTRTWVVTTRYVGAQISQGT